MGGLVRVVLFAVAWEAAAVCFAGRPSHGVAYWRVPGQDVLPTRASLLLPTRARAHPLARNPVFLRGVVGRQSLVLVGRRRARHAVARARGNGPADFLFRRSPGLGQAALAQSFLGIVRRAG